MKVYMLVGCPGSGKTWVANQLKEKFHLIHHDAYIGMAGDTYVKEILKYLRTKTDTKPILIESPFSISQIKIPLEKRGVEIETVFIQEDDNVIRNRYQSREKKPIPQGHLTRQKTYRDRAKEYGSFSGTSSQCLDYLNSKA